MSIEIHETRCFETDTTGRPAPSAAPRPAPLPRQSKSGASPSSSFAGRSPSPAARAPARLSAREVADELFAQEWLAMCGLSSPLFADRRFQDGEGLWPLVREVNDLRVVNWAGLSPRAARILHTIAHPIALGGYKEAELAELLQERREEIDDLHPPDPITATWVRARMKELRTYAEAT